MTTEKTEPETATAVSPLRFERYVPSGFEGKPADVVDALKRGRAVLAEEEDRWMRGSWFCNSHPQKDIEDPYCNSWKVCAEGAVLIVTVGTNNQPMQSQYFNVEEGEHPWVGLNEPQYYSDLAEVLDAEQLALYEKAIFYLRNVAQVITGVYHTKANAYNDYDFDSRKEVLNWFDKTIGYVEKGLPDEDEYDA